MTLQQIIDQRSRFLQFDLDDCYDPDTVTTQQKVDSVNWAIRVISQRLNQFNPSIPFTLTAGTSIYDLTDTTIVGHVVIRPLHVIINGNVLPDASGRDDGVWQYTEFQRATRGKWRSDPQGVPSKAVDQGNNRLILHPPPDAATAAASNYIAGIYLASDMTTGQLASSPDIPVWCHEAISFLAAYHSAISQASASEGWQRLGAYSQEWQASIDDTSRRNQAALQSWGSTSGTYLPDYLEF